MYVQVHEIMIVAAAFGGLAGIVLSTSLSAVGRGLRAIATRRQT